jgi:integrase
MTEQPPSKSPDPKQLMLDQLWPRATSRYADAAISDNTRRAYRSDLAHFLAWGGTLPSSVQEIIDYLEAHAQSHSIRTLRRRVATLKEAHRLLDVECPADSPVIRRVLRGIANREGRPAKKAPPLLVDQASRIIRRLDGSVAGVRDRALILVGWALFLRRSELVSIRREDVRISSDRMLIAISRSKTDQENVGNLMSLPRTGGPACPVAALEQWLGISGITTGPLFRRVFRGGALGKEHQGLTAHSVNLIIKKRALEAGVDEPALFSGHSLRRGGITQAYAGNTSEADIQRVSRHRSLLQLRDYRDDATALLGHQPSQDFLMALNESLMDLNS